MRETIKRETYLRYNYWKTSSPASMMSIEANDSAKLFTKKFKG